MGGERPIKSVAVIGGGASGTIAAASLKAENYFDKISVFERRDTAGGTWIYDPNPGPELSILPGKLPPEIDPPLAIPNGLPRITAPSQQERYSQTPVYESLTTNVPDIAMSFSDQRFAYGPFPPHHIPRTYLENYVALHKLDEHLILSTTVEDLSKVPASSSTGLEKWKLTLRRHDALRNVDIWWKETFDAVIIANGHYSVPYIPHVEGLEAYTKAFPDRIVHSKYYRSPSVYKGQRVLTIGNSASGFDITKELVQTAALPVINSRRHRSPFEHDGPPAGIAWAPVIKRFHADGTIEFADDPDNNDPSAPIRTLGPDDIDKIIYCTGYRPSYSFWNVAHNGREIYDYTHGKLINTYWHTFFSDMPRTLAIVGIQRALTFRGMEYQAVALARWFAGRNALPLPSAEEMRAWEQDRLERVVLQHGGKFHDVELRFAGLSEETLNFLGWLYEFAGLGTLKGDGRIPPVLSREVLHALKTIRKYPLQDEDVAGEEEDRAVDVKQAQNAVVGIDNGGRAGLDYNYRRYQENDESDWVVVLGL